MSKTIGTIIGQLISLFLTPLLFVWVWNNVTAPADPITYAAVLKTQILAALPLWAFAGLCFQVAKWAEE